MGNSIQYKRCYFASQKMAPAMLRARAYACPTIVNIWNFELVGKEHAP
jgi:hypothetical protein